ncbi:MAG TPA: hypothetical protein VHN18_08415 [Micromonosporaceae bacterium]|nr:hypothetical protein [Micromonosporaceae bacterium]
MAAKRKKTKRAGDGPAITVDTQQIEAAGLVESLDLHAGVRGSAPRDDERAGFVPPANGPVRGRAGVGRGQAASQARRYAFRRS